MKPFKQISCNLFQLGQETFDSRDKIFFSVPVILKDLFKHIRFYTLRT